MRNYIIRRLLLFFPTLILASIIIFVIMRIVPGDPAIAILGGEGGEGVYTQADLDSLRQKLGFDKPIHVQYLVWIWGVVRLDMGDSLWMGTPVIDELKRRFPLTLELALLTFSVAVSIAIPAGVISALRQDTSLDYTVRVFSILGLAMPTFWIGTMTLLILSLWFNWVPPMGYASPWQDLGKNLEQLIWPALGLGYYQNAITARMTRAQMLEVLRQDYIRTAWAKGLQTRAVVFGHALKNAVLPVVTLWGIQVGHLLGGAIVMETIFSLPGIGRLLITSVFNRDYPMIQAIILFIAFVFLVINLAVDLLYGWLDPRIRYQ